MIARPRQPTLLIGLAVLVAVVLALAHVYVRLQLIQAGYELSRESRLRHELRDKNQQLRLELAVRKDPGRVEERARAMGMAPADPRAFRTVRLGAPPAAPTTTAAEGDGR